MTYLKGNLSALRTKQVHHGLIARLESLSPSAGEALPNGYQVATGPNGDISLLFEGQPLHDLDSPTAEAQRIVMDGLTPHRHGQNLILGLGLGYLLQEACQVKDTNRFAALIVVYEPDMALLHFILSNVDLRTYLINTHVTLFHEPLGFLQHVRANYIQGDGLGILFTPGTMAAHRTQMMALLRHIKSTVGTACRNNRTKQLQAKQWGTQFLANLPTFLTLPSVDQLAGRLAGKTLVVCHNGPSLIAAMASLQAVAHHVIVVATPQAAVTLNAAGLTPHFIVWMEAVDDDHLLSSDKAAVWANSHLIVSPTVPPAVLQQPAKSQWVALNELFGPFLDKVWGQSLKRYPSGGATLQMALHLAATLGANQLILLGIDPPPTTTELQDQDDLTQAPGWNPDGPLVTLTEAWADLGLLLETSATRLKADHPGLSLVNASVGSALLQGFEQCPFDTLVPTLLGAPFTDLDTLLAEAHTQWQALHSPAAMAQLAQAQLTDMGNRVYRALTLTQQAQPLLAQLLAAPTDQLLALSEPYSAVFNDLAATIECHPMLKEWLYHEQLMLYQGHNDTANTYKEHLDNFEQDRLYMETLAPVLHNTLLPAILEAQQTIGKHYPAVSMATTALASA